MDIVCFRQDSQWFGLLSGSVVDLVPTAHVEPVDSGPPYLAGVAHSRWGPLLVVRVAPLLYPDRMSSGMQTKGASGRVTTSLLVVGRGVRLLGLPAEIVSCILELRQERLAEYRSSVSGQSVIRTRICHLDREITLLDSMRLIRLVETALGETTLGIFCAGFLERWDCQ